MNCDFSKKSTVEEIKERFDNDVERFSNLQTGQSATIDAPLAMELITGAALASARRIERILDIGCGAGNNTIKLLGKLGNVPHCTLVDLSPRMLERAKERISALGNDNVETICGDFRNPHWRKTHTMLFWLRPSCIICAATMIGSPPLKRFSRF